MCVYIHKIVCGLACTLYRAVQYVGRYANSMLVVVSLHLADYQTCSEILCDTSFTPHLHVGEKKIVLLFVFVLVLHSCMLKSL